MVKNIIKRIIVGVGIALCLMAIKGGLIADVSALTPKTASPTAFHFGNVGGGVYDRDLSSGYMQETLIYYYTFSNSYTRTFTSFDYFNNSISLNTLYSVNFSIYSSLSSFYEEPFRVSLNNGSKYYSCFVESQSYRPGNSGSGSTAPATDVQTFSTVYCPNVVLTSSSNFTVYVYGQSPSVPDTFIGITKATFVPDGNSTELQNINNAVNETNNTIKDDTVDNNSISSTIQNGSNQIASNNSITQLLTLPISLYQNILNSVSGSCSSFSLGTLYNHQLTLPCINLQNLLGSTLYSIIDILISGLFILSFRKKMVDIFNNMTSLKDRGNELE